ncbi:hypothetical protein C8Q78DRAFT_1074853 [Trametes maxima]|nr:hypothetical protein C8Q78DRAFT_1074853 [Trametes maxima]
MHLPYVLSAFLTVAIVIAIARKFRRNGTILQRHATAGRLDFKFAASAVVRPKKVTEIKMSIPSTPLRHRNRTPTIFRELDTLAIKADPGINSCEPLFGLKSDVDDSRSESPFHPRTPFINLHQKSRRAVALVRDTASVKMRTPQPTPDQEAILDPPSLATSMYSNSVTDTEEGSSQPAHARSQSPPAGVVLLEPPLIRHRFTAPKAHLDGVDDVDARRTWWFETASNDTIPCPPARLAQQDDLRPGDLFLHRIDKKQHQLWHWVDDEGLGLHWKSIHVGSRRADGRRLTLTPKQKRPSWVGEDWYIRQGLANTL